MEFTSESVTQAIWKIGIPIPPTIFLGLSILFTINIPANIRRGEMKPMLVVVSSPSSFFLIPIIFPMTNQDTMNVIRTGNICVIGRLLSTNKRVVFADRNTAIDAMVRGSMYFSSLVSLFLNEEMI